MTRTRRGRFSMPLKAAGRSGSRPRASRMVAANLMGSAVSSTIMGVSFCANWRATFTPSAVWVSTSTPYCPCTLRMVARRSAWVLLPLAKPNCSRAAAKRGWRLKSNWPCCASVWPKRARVAAASRPSRSNTKRSKLLALLMSMLGLLVSNVSALPRTRYRPVRKNSSSTSFSLVATMRRRMGSPIMRATWPAQMLPKLPLGTVKSTVCASLCVACIQPAK